MSIQLRVSKPRLCQRLDALAQKGALPNGGVSRLALSDADKEGRDLVLSWMKELGLTAHVDQVGNLIGIRPGMKEEAPVMVGSHVDTVNAGGRFDGSYGVLAGLEVVQTLNEVGIQTRRPLAVVAFTNEEGARYTTDMMGSQAFCGALSVQDVWAIQGLDGSVVGEELRRIGYKGDFPCGAIKPHAYVELHVEQGPLLDQAHIPIGAVEAITGISWQEITIQGAANHAGTTPMELRHDAGLVAARVIAFLRELATAMGPNQRTTCGRLSLSPAVINVIPEKAVLTVDLRNGDDAILQEAEKRLAAFVEAAAAQESVTAATRLLARVPPAQCHPLVIEQIEQAAQDLGYPFRRMTSGAGHDAQIVARVCPTAMIFVPSKDGISHSPAEYSSPGDLEAGANVLLHTVLRLANQ